MMNFIDFAGLLSSQLFLEDWLELLISVRSDTHVSKFVFLQEFVQKDGGIGRSSRIWDCFPLASWILDGSMVLTGKYIDQSQNFTKIRDVNDV